MKRRSNTYAGNDVSQWTPERLQRLLALKPGEPLGFARHRHDPAEVLGFAPTSLARLKAQARAELRRRR